MQAKNKIPGTEPENTDLRDGAPSPPSRLHWSAWASWVVLILSLAITLAVWNESRKIAATLLQGEFHALIVETRNKLDDRIGTYTQVLRSAAALFAASGTTVSRGHWQRFIEMQQLERNYPAIASVAFARSVKDADLPQFIAAMRRSGIEDFAVRPPGKRESYVINAYAEPFSGGNIKALGYDMWQDADRRMTMERAAESGQPMITQRLTLRIDEKNNPVPAFIMYLPVRIEGGLYGYVLSPFRMPALLQDLLGSRAELITLDIYDGTVPVPDKLFYQSDNGKDSTKPRLTELQTLEIGGRKWTLVFSTRTGLEAKTYSDRPITVIVIGMFFSLLLFIITWSLGRTKARSEAIAQEMTRSFAESQNLLQEIVDNSSALIYMKDLNGRYLFVNRAWYELFHTNSDDVKGKTDLELFPEDIARRFMDNDHHVLESGDPLDIEEIALLADGFHHYQSTKVAIRDHHGKIYGLCGISTDMTERKRSDEELKKSNEMFSLFMRYSPVYVFIKEVDSTGSRVLQASENFQEMVGIKGSEMIGKTMEELFPPEFAAKITVDDRTVVAKGEVLKIDEELGGRCYTTIKFPLVQGDKTLLAGFTIDITERKRVEEALRQSEATFRKLFEDSSDAILLIDETGVFVECNQAALDLLKMTRDQFLLLSPARISPEFQPSGRRSAEAAPEMIELAYSKGLHRFDWTCVNAEGGEFIVEVSLMPVTIKGQVMLHTTWRDITERTHADNERQSMEKQLLHAQKLESLGVLAGGIAHDFNNILMAIIGNADLALMRINKESPATENLHRIEQAAARAADLAKQMLAYSGKGKFVVENIDLNILLEEMLHMLEVSISKKAVLRLNLHKPLPSVEADATQMRQIIMNLVINASEAIGDKSGVIAITTGCMECDKSYLKNVWLDENISEGLYVYCEIADSGCGMSKETLSKLFDPFFTTKFTGRGLGMAAVLGIVRGHKGAIKVYSEPEKGTTFKILLPTSDRPAELFNDNDHPDDWRGSGTVLLVDDEETVRAIGSEMLKELGFNIVTANDGREAVDIFKTRDDISFVILDLTMPHMDGEQCFRELRQLKPNVKVMMSSGYNEQEVSQKFAGKGMAGFIQKPYRLSILKEAIRVML